MLHGFDALSHGIHCCLVCIRPTLVGIRTLHAHVHLRKRVVLHKRVLTHKYILVYASGPQRGGAEASRIGILRGAHRSHDFEGLRAQRVININNAIQNLYAVTYRKPLYELVGTYHALVRLARPAALAQEYAVYVGAIVREDDVCILLDALFYGVHIHGAYARGNLQVAHTGHSIHRHGWHHTLHAFYDSETIHVTARESHSGHKP